MPTSICLRTLYNLPRSPPIPEVLRKEIPLAMSDNESETDASLSGSGLYDLWKASRASIEQSDTCCERVPSQIQAGLQRRCSITNMCLAFRILQATFGEMISFIWSIDPFRITLLIFLTIVRGFLPAFKGYSQALIIDEVSITFLYLLLMISHPDLLEDSATCYQRGLCICEYRPFDKTCRKGMRPYGGRVAI